MASDPAILQELKTQLMSFRVTELQMLLSFAGKNKTGKKLDLQSRALNLLQKGNLTLNVQNKIRELHRQRCAGNSTVDSTSMSICYGPTSVNSNLPQSNTSGCPNRVVGSTTSVTNPTQSSNYYFSMPRGLTTDYSQNMKPWMSSSMSLPYPVLADVKFKALPFYDNLAELLKPATLMPTTNSRFQESNFSFHLTPQQANDVSLSREFKPDGRIEHTVQIQLRFCLMETSCEQEDNFPPNICVKINSKLCPLPNPLANNKPGIEPKRPSRPVNITALCRISPTTMNQIFISWASEFNRAYAIGVFLVKKLTANQLLQRIKAKGIRNSEYTRAMIKEKLAHDPDSEIATMSLRGSLICPLGKMRMQLPIRAVTCSHIQCFDALLYLQMNEKKPSWICPVCDKSALFSHLVIDGLFTEIINHAPSGCTEVQLMEDGSWDPVAPKKDACEAINDFQNKSKLKRELESAPLTIKKSKVEAEVITLDSSDDEESHVPPIAQSTTPVLLSSGSSTSETPNLMSLPSPDSSTESSLTQNNTRPTTSLSIDNTFPDSSIYSNPSRCGINGIVGSRRNSSGMATPCGSNNISSSSSFIGINNNNNQSHNPPYPPFSNPFSETYINNVSNHPFPNYNMYINQMFQGDISRDIQTYRNVGTSSASRRPIPSMSLDPDIIAID